MNRILASWEGPVPAGGDGLREALAWLDLADDMLDRYGDKLTPIRVRAVHGYVQHARAALAALQEPGPERCICDRDTLADGMATPGSPVHGLGDYGV